MQQAFTNFRDCLVHKENYSLIFDTFKSCTTVTAAQRAAYTYPVLLATR